MKSSSKEAILFAIFLIVINEIAAKPPNAIKDVYWVAPNWYAYVARLVLNGTDGEQTTCAGSIITPRHILTAGSCLYGKTGGIVYTHIQHGVNESAVVSDIDQLYLDNFAERTENQSAQNDIGIVTLTTDLVFSIQQTAILLPSSLPNYREGFEIDGWVPTSEKGDVQLTFKRTLISFSSDKDCLKTDDDKSKKICDRSAYVCPGEPGSPIIGYGIIHAIATEDPCIEETRYYTDVFHHIEWIKRIIELLYQSE